MDACSCSDGTFWPLYAYECMMCGKTAVNMRETQEETQKCPVCGHEIGAVAGSKEAICTNCGFKDPCCE